MTLKGRLENFGLGELLQTLALNQHTGTLVLSSPNATKKIYFSTGSITLLSTGESVRLGEIFERQGLIDHEVIAEAEKTQRATGKLFGQILIELGHVTAQDVENALRQKIEEEIYDVFLWSGGEFEFLHNHCPSELMDPLQKLTQISIDPNSVIMEGLRQLDEFRTICEHIPDQKAFVERAVADLPADMQLTSDGQRVWDLLNEPQQVEILIRRSGMSRFHSLATLHEFVQNGWARLLDFEQHRELAQSARKSGNPGLAVQIYAYLSNLSDPQASEPTFLRDAGELLVESKRQDIGFQLLDRAIFGFVQREDKNSAWATGKRRTALGPTSVDVLRTLWQIRAAGTDRERTDLFESYIETLLDEEEFGELEKLLSTSEAEFSGDPRWWGARGHCNRVTGHDAEAVECFEHAAMLHSEQKELPEAIRLYRAVYDIDPSRDDIAERLKHLLSAQEKIEARKRRKFTMAGALCIVAVCLCAIPVIYELRARALYDQTHLLAVAYALDDLEVDETAIQEALRKERAFGGHQDSALERVKDQYREVLDKYPYSSASTRASDALAQLESYESAVASALAKEKRLEAEAESRKIQDTRQRLEDLASRANELEATRNYTALRKIHQELLAESRNPLMPKKSIEFVTRIESVPPGATVMLGEQVLGRTPTAVRFVPTSKLELRLEREGCLSKYLEIDRTTAADVSVTLERVPLQQIRFPAIDGEVAADDERILVPARDGRLYSLLRHQLFAEIATWSRLVGTPGHPTTQILPIGDDVLLVAYDGTVERINKESGKASWTREIDAPIRSRGDVDIAGEFITFGTENGDLYSLSIRDGEIVVQTRLDYPIVAVRHVENSLHVLDRAGHWFELDRLSLQQKKMRRVSINSFVFTPAGGILDRTGRHWTSDGKHETWPVPTTRVLERDGEIRYGSRIRKSAETEVGAWVVRRADGSIEQIEISVIPTSAPFFIEDRVYLSGVDGNLYCFDRTGTELYRMDIDADICDVVAGRGQHLIVFLAAGGVLKIERESQ